MVDVSVRCGLVTGCVWRLTKTQPMLAAVAVGEAAGCSIAACTVHNAGPAAAESKLLAVPTSHIHTQHFSFIVYPNDAILVWYWQWLPVTSLNCIEMTGWIKLAFGTETSLL